MEEGATVSQPIIHVSADYGRQQTWNFLYAWQGMAEQDAWRTDTGNTILILILNGDTQQRGRQNERQRETAKGNERRERSQQNSNLQKKKNPQQTSRTAGNGKVYL